MSPAMMQAVVFDRHGGPEVLALREIPIPVPGPNDALSRIKAAGFNFNDVWGRRGLPGMDFHLPHISGSDASGVVVAVGSEVRTVKPGDEVMASGAFACHQCPACQRGDIFTCRDFRIWGFQTGPLQGAQAQYGVVPAADLLPKPPNLSFVEAASLPLCLVTAWRMLVVRARIQPGDFVLVWGGAGGLGTMAIQICALFGARAIAVVASDEKAEYCKRLGAEFVLNRKTQRLVREIQRITDKRGVDIVFEHVGQTTWETSSMALRWGGTIVICGATSGYTGTIDFRFLWNKQQNYLGSHYGTTAELEQALRFVASGKIRPQVHSVVPMAEVARAHAMLENDEVMGKVVLVPPEEGA